PSNAATNGAAPALDGRTIRGRARASSAGLAFFPPKACRRLHLRQLELGRAACLCVRASSALALACPIRPRARRVRHGLSAELFLRTLLQSAGEKEASTSQRRSVRGSGLLAILQGARQRPALLRRKNGGSPVRRFVHKTPGANLARKRGCGESVLGAGPTRRAACRQALPDPSRSEFA